MREDGVNTKTESTIFIIDLKSITSLHVIGLVKEAASWLMCPHVKLSLYRLEWLI